MKPKTKILILVFSLVLPYMALVMYFALRIQEHPLPIWFPYFGLSYILGTIIVVMVFSRKIYRTAGPVSEKKPKSVLLWLGRAWMVYLVVLWCGFFLRDAYRTLTGSLFSWHLLDYSRGGYTRIISAREHKHRQRTQKS